MENNKLQPLRSIIMAVRNFQRFSDLCFVGAFEFIFILKLAQTVKYNFQNTKRPPEQQIFPYNQLNSVKHDLEASK